MHYSQKIPILLTKKSHLLFILIVLTNFCFLKILYWFLSKSVKKEMAPIDKSCLDQISIDVKRFEPSCMNLSKCTDGIPITVFFLYHLKCKHKWQDYIFRQSTHKSKFNTFYQITQLIINMRYPTMEQYEI